MKKHKHIKRILHRDFDDYLLRFENSNIYNNEQNGEKEAIMYEDCIWIYWDNPINMPEIVKSCISSIRKNANGRKIMIVSESNVFDYVSIAPNIQKKYRKGIISKTHFSDIVRISLLEKYGGVYMDATILQTRKMPDYVTKSDFFTFKLKIEKAYEVVSNGNWCVFFISCKKNNLLMKVTLDMMNAYWEQYDFLVDYLWIDYLWITASERIPAIKKMLLDVPCSNPNLFSLRDLMAKCTYEEYKQRTGHEDTAFYKMSYKGTKGIPLRDGSGHTTLLGRIIENN